MPLIVTFFGACYTNSSSRLAVSATTNVTNALCYTNVKSVTIHLCGISDTVHSTSNKQLLFTIKR